MLTEHFIHIHVPKTGGQFIRGIIHERDMKNKIKVYNEGTHMTLDESKKRILKYTDKLVPSFCFVRNPWAWYVSRFFFRRKIVNTVKEKIELDHCPSTIEGFQQHMEMLKTLYLNGENKNFPGRTYQFITLSDYHNYLVCDGTDYIGYLENFHNDLIKILFKIAPMSFPIKWLENKLKTKANVSKHDHYSKYYTNDLRDVVAKWDSEYIEKFSYKFTEK